MTNDQWTVVDRARDNENTFDSRSDAEDAIDQLRSLEGVNPDDLELVAPGATDGGSTKAEVVKTPETDPRTTPRIPDDPIDWLRSKDEDYVNTIKNTPTISKRGFRYLQSEFQISTESEVVATFDDPFGVIVWARAELPNGRSAEAHGEGYQFEDGIDDNEFVRYADSRAKSRALSDLTAAGELASSELKGDGTVRE